MSEIGLGFNIEASGPTVLRFIMGESEECRCCSRGYTEVASEAGPAQVLKISPFRASFLEIIVQQQVDILRGRSMLIYPPLAGLLFS